MNTGILTIVVFLVLFAIGTLAGIRGLIQRRRAQRIFNRLLEAHAVRPEWQCR